MPERSLRLSPGTPPDMVIAALNGALERLDSVEGKRKHPWSYNFYEVIDSLDPNSVKLLVEKDGTWTLSGKPFEAQDIKVGGTTGNTEPLTEADVRQAVEHAVRETRTGIPDATAPWTLHLGPGCTVENTESGNHFTVEPGNAIPLDADVKLSVLDKAEGMIDPRAKAEPVSRLTPGFVRRREVREAVENLQRVLGIPMSGLVGHDTLTAVKFLAELAKH